MVKKISNQDAFDESKINGKAHGFWHKFFFAIFIIYIGLFVIFMGFYLDFKSKFECVHVLGISMQPTINSSVVPGDPKNPEEKADWVYTSKVKPTYGDVVVLDAKEYNGKEECIIKRVIALEGDAVTIVKKYDEELEKKVFKVCVIKAENLEDGKIDDEDVVVLNEDYISSAEEWTYNSRHTVSDSEIYDAWFKFTYITNGSGYIKDDEGVIYTIVPEGEFFYLGDNRSHSSDSRMRGTDYVSSISGVVQFTVKDAESSGSAIFVQIKEVIIHYGNIIGNFFSQLWESLTNSFAI